MWLHLIEVFRKGIKLKVLISQLKKRGINMSKVAEKVKEIVVEQLGISPEQVSNDSKFIEDLGADSLDQVELIMALEEEFGTDIPDDEAEKLATVQDAITYVEANQ